MFSLLQTSESSQILGIGQRNLPEQFIFMIDVLFFCKLCLSINTDRMLIISEMIYVFETPITHVLASDFLRLFSLLT